MKRIGMAVLLSSLLAALPSAARTLEILFIDVEGGQSTLIVTPGGESLLIDAGFGGRAGSRDVERILEAAREAHVDRIDYLLITHLHPDHAGGVPELASRIPIGTFIDYGEPLGTDRMANGAFRGYEPVRNQGRHIQPQPGDRLPLKDLEARIVSAGGIVLSKPLDGGGQPNDACANAEDPGDDGTENYRSIGVMLRFGSFRFLDLGDLSGNTLTSLVCPRNLVGHVSVYLIAHHGNYDSNVPAIYEALRPRVAIMNNGVAKGGSPEAFRTAHAAPGLEDVWQLHQSRNPRAENAPDPLIANVDDGATAYWLKLTATNDGGFRIVNSRTGFTKTYSRKPRQDRQ